MPSGFPAVYFASAMAFLLGCEQAAPAREKLRLGTSVIPSYVLLYVAEDEGFIAAEGLDLEKVTFESGRDALRAALADRVDFATVYGTPLLLAILDGADVVAVTHLHRARNLTGLVARPGSGIESPADLRGRRIGVTPRTNADFMLEILLAEASLRRNDLQIVHGDQSRLLGALAAGEVDGAMLWAQNLLSAPQLFASPPAVLTSDAYREFSLLAGKRTVLERHREAVRRLLRALRRAEQFVDANPDVVRRVLHERFPQLSTEELERVRLLSRFEVGVSNLTLAMLREEADWIEAQQVVRPAANMRIRDVLDAALLEEVAPESVTLLRHALTSEGPP